VGMSCRKKCQCKKCDKKETCQPCLTCGNEKYEGCVYFIPKKEQVMKKIKYAILDYNNNELKENGVILTFKTIENAEAFLSGMFKGMFPNGTEKGLIEFMKEYKIIITY